MDKNLRRKLQFSKKCNKTLLQSVTEYHYGNVITTNNSYYKDCGITSIAIAIIMMYTLLLKVPQN